MGKNSIWFNKSAATWDEALPLGNGRLGAMVFGNPHKEQIQLNEDSVWYGGPMDRNNLDAYDNLPAIRELSKTVGIAFINSYESANSIAIEKLRNCSIEKESQDVEEYKIIESKFGRKNVCNIWKKI
jgi:hypothetical protein